MFVVDSSDRERMGIAKQELLAMLEVHMFEHFRKLDREREQASLCCDSC